MTNPYDLTFLRQLIRQEETQQLEFKSSEGLKDKKGPGAFVSKQIVPCVSAFLNTAGGRLVVGMEERKGTAFELSKGVARNQLDRDQLQRMICDRIQPAVASNVRVDSVNVGKDDKDNNLFAFVVTVEQGVTAYQADDKMYYSRRSGETVAMEDKDIRLRMLAGDKPRLSIRLCARNQLSGSAGQYNGVEWDLEIENPSLRTIQTAVISLAFKTEGLTIDGERLLRGMNHRTRRKTDFYDDKIDESGLKPGDIFLYKSLFSASSMAFTDLSSIVGIALTLDVTVFIDDGPPCELKGQDLMARVRPLHDADWRATDDS